MRLTALVLALLGLASVADAQGTQTIEAPREIGAPLILEVTVRRYGQDNQMSASAGDSATTGKLESYVSASASLCGLSASNNEPASTPSVGWHFTGEVLSSSAGQMTVRVDWQRIWDKGARIQNGPAGSQTIALRAGERVELDRVVPVGQSPCSAADARLEAAVVARPAYRVGALSGQFNGAAAGGRGGIGGGGRGGAATGVQSGAAGGRGATMTGAQSGATTTDSTVQSNLEFNKTQLGYRVTVVAQYDAELWLVHRGPDGVETVQQQTVRFGVSGINYTFPSISVQTSTGPITVDITGKLQAFVGDPPDPNRAFPAVATAYYFERQAVAGDTQKLQPRLMVTIGRRARASGPPLLDITGGSSIAMELPAPTDVVSFELPALQKAAEDLTKGHQFSLRVRVTPIAK